MKNALNGYLNLMQNFLDYSSYFEKALRNFNISLEYVKSFYLESERIDMASKTERIIIFENTIQMCDSNNLLCQSVNTSLAKQRIYWDEDNVQPDSLQRYDQTELILSRERTCEAAKSYSGKRVCILNFASFVTPGGGVARGTTAQEESICRISTLYKCITNASVRIYYDSHWDKINKMLIDRGNNDDIIYTPGVTVFKADTFDCELLPESEWYTVDVITCAAPDLRYSNHGVPFRPTEEELTALLEKRWRKILAVSADHNVEVLILGAFGCGAFYNPPQIVAKAAENACKDYDRCFEKIVFAVYAGEYENENYKAFSSIKGIMEKTANRI